MSERFEALSEEKQKRIMDACLHEFAEHGYLNASTNRIVGAASISKGLLFHYFGNKKKLFLYVLDFVINTMMTQMNKYTLPLSGDFFERVGDYTLIKMRIGIEEPEMYHILYDVYLNLPKDIKNELMQRYGAILSDQRKALVSTIDSSRLKEGVTPEMAVNVIVDFLDGYYKRNIEHYKTMTPDELLLHVGEMKGDIMGYLDIIRRGIYKDVE